MRVLVVKTSSLGDIIHTFPALTDAANAIPELRVDWLVEQGFSDVPGWHPAVDRVIPIAWRKWRKHLIKNWREGKFAAFKQALQQSEYDQVIDAQGLLKSAIPALFARGNVAGFNRYSAREPLAARLYRFQYDVDKQQHAIARVRALFASALSYQIPDSDPDYGIAIKSSDDYAGRPYLVMVHATTWSSKHWPESYWAQLCQLGTRAGFRVLFPWGSPDDRLQAERIMKLADSGELLPAMGLDGIAQVLKGAAGVVGVDSGLAHITAALGTPAVTLYGPTRTELTGALGPAQKNLAANYECAPCMHRDCARPMPREPDPPCFGTLPPMKVWEQLRIQMHQREDMQE